MPAIAAIPLFSISLGTLGTITVTVGTVASVTLAAGAIVYSQIQAREMEKKARAAMLQNQGMTLTTREPAAPQRVIYGRARAGGTFVFMHITDVDGGPPNEYLHLVIVLAGHEVEEIGDVFFDDVLVPLNVNGAATSGRYKDHVVVKKHLGTADQLVDPVLKAAAPSKWTDNHRLRGLAYIYVRLKYEANIFSGLPNITAIVKGKKVYDPRTGLTAWSDNPVLCLRDYLTNTEYGLGAAADEIDDTSFIAKANLCDEDVLLADGVTTEKRYTCNGGFTLDMQPSTVVENLVGSFAGSLIYTGGTWSVAGGSYETPVLNFGMGDLRGDITIQTADSRRDTCNAVKGTYVSEKNRWQPSDYPPVKNATYLTEDGERIWRDLDLPWTTSSSTAQRLAKIELERARQDLTVKVPLKLSGLKAKAGDVVTLTMSRYGWVNKPFEVMNWRFAMEDAPGIDGRGGMILGVDLELRETASGVWDWNNGEETTVDLAPDTTLPDWTLVVAPSSLSVTSDFTINPDGSGNPRLNVSWVPPADAFAVAAASVVQVQFKLAADSEWTNHGSFPGDTTRTTISGLTAGLTYLVRVRTVSVIGASSEWVTSSSVPAAGDTVPPSVPTGAAVAAIYKGARVTWINPADTDLAYVEVYEASAATPAPDAASLALAQIYGTDYVRQGLAAGAERWYWVRAVDASGNKSAWVSAGNATASAIDTTGIFPINSTQIEDGAISTPKLAANSVTAEKVGTNEIVSTEANLANAVVTNAKIANLAVDGAKIANLAVDTLKLADQAVTIPVSAYSAGSLSLSATYTTVQTATIESTGAPILVGMALAMENPGAGTFSVRLRRDGVTVFELASLPLPAIPPGGSGGGIFAFNFTDVPTAGSRTYTLQYSHNVGGFVTVKCRSLSLLETKK